MLRQRDVLARLLLCLLAVLAIWLITRSWAPAFSYRSGYIPSHEITARTSFTVSPDGQDPRTYISGEALLPAGRPLSFDDTQLLYEEHIEFEANRSLL